MDKYVILNNDPI